MGITEKVCIIIFGVIAIGFRLWLLYEISFRKSSFTICPKCKKQKQRVKKGKYKCDDCQFIFEVDKYGDSINNSIWMSVFMIGLGFTFLILAVNYYFKPETALEKAFKDLNPDSIFDKIFYPSIYLIMIGTLFYFGISGIKGYIKDKKNNS